MLEGTNCNTIWKTITFGEFFQFFDDIIKTAYPENSLFYDECKEFSSLSSEPAPKEETSEEELTTKPVQQPKLLTRAKVERELTQSGVTSIHTGSPVSMMNVSFKNQFSQPYFQ